MKLYSRYGLEAESSRQAACQHFGERGVGTGGHELRGPPRPVAGLISRIGTSCYCSFALDEAARLQIVFENLTDKFNNSLAARGTGREVYLRLDRIDGVGNGYGTLTLAEKREVVFGVSDTDNIPPRELHLLQSSRQTAGFIHPDGQDHHRIFVEGDLPFEAKLASSRDVGPL